MSHLTTYVHRGERFTPFRTAMTTLSGNAGRVYFATAGDSTQFITPTKNDGSGAETIDQPGGHHEGIALALVARGFTMYGSQIMNYARNNYNSHGVTAVFPAAQDFALDPVGSALAAKSFPYSNTGLPGCLFYIDAASFYPTSGFSGSYVCALSQASPYVASSTRSNPYFFGNMTTTQVRCSFSYATTSTNSFSVVSVLESFQQQSVLSPSTRMTVASNTGGAWVEAQLLIPANADATQNRVITLWDRIGNYNVNPSGTDPTYRSKGPAWFSGFQFTLDSVDLASPTTGTGGFAVGPLYAHGGFSSSQMNAELKYAGIAAIAEYLRAATRHAQKVVVMFQHIGNDIGGTTKYAFDYAGGDAGMLDATAYTGVVRSGQQQNTPAGALTNLKSFVAMILEAWSTLGRDVNDILIVAGCYHNQDSSPWEATMPTIFTEWAKWADSGEDGSERVVVVRGDKTVYPPDMRKRVWFNGVGQNDSPHMSAAGFVGHPKSYIDHLLAWSHPLKTPNPHIINTPHFGNTDFSAKLSNRP